MFNSLVVRKVGNDATGGTTLAQEENPYVKEILVSYVDPLKPGHCPQDRAFGGGTPSPSLAGSGSGSNPFCLRGEGQNSFWGPFNAAADNGQLFPSKIVAVSEL